MGLNSDAPARSGAISTNKIWSWRGVDRPELPPDLRDKFKSTDECKPVEGGAKILITSSGGGVALVERSSGKALFHAVQFSQIRTFIDFGQGKP
jgi:hypothetical protein